MALTQFTDDDYYTILATIVETARGRWFLGEYAKRSRHTEIEMILTEISKLRSGQNDSLFDFKTLSSKQTSQLLDPVIPGSHGGGILLSMNKPQSGN
jgi:hypothetical protein